jgi:protein-L-isoaspartate(D-aspartate) O-methyltransferase
MGEQLADAFLSKRQLMVELQLRQRGIRDSRVLQAFLDVPRHEFVPIEKRVQAYDDQPLEIGAGQTISQPYIIAAMLQALALTGKEHVLDVGTGSGYVAALLSRLAAQVFTIERHALLLESARSLLVRLGYNNIAALVGDGSRGLPEWAPFDAILVSAAAPKVPESLLQQLTQDGRLVIPVGGLDSQMLVLVRKEGSTASVQELDSCRFVPLIGGEGFPV